MTEYIYKTIGERELSLYVMEPTVKKYDKSPICVFIPGGGWKVSNGKGMLGFSKRIVDKVLSEGCTAVGIEKPSLYNFRNFFYTFFDLPIDFLCLEC